MYIKQIIIQGFKSYKDQTIIEPFSPGTNVVVGRNGSGKSNFFAAIRFVLSDAYTQMSREERQALLHEGSGSAVMSAYVEVIFDNSDHRFAGNNNDEVVLRRTIGLKKDEYSIDRKVVTKQEVTSTLEAAGFSRSNPYYIVPQGRVTALTNMKESDRLNLLKEVAGTKVYEARRAESLKIMHETNNKREKIDELLDYIKDRLEELEEEKEELRGFQDKDREKRCLEYATWHREQVALADKLAQVDAAREGGSESTNQNQKSFIRGEKAIAKITEKLHGMQQQMDLLKIDRRQLEDDRRDNAKALAKAELKVQNLTDNQSSREQARQQHTRQLEEVRAEIAQKEQELNKLMPQYTKRKIEEAEVRAKLDASEALRHRLLTKQTRTSQFRTKAERDKWLNNEIQDINLTLSNQKANRMNADEEVKEVATSIKQLEKDIEDIKSTLSGWGTKRFELAAEVTAAKDVVDKLQEEKKLLRRDDDRQDSIITNARSERDHAERDLTHTMDGPTSRGLATIRRLKRERDIPGAYGTLAELMDVPEAYRVPVEQIAGNSLFHYVVDNAETATLLSKLLHEKRGGRITFMPLEQLRPRLANFPKAQDAVALISKIQFEPKYEKAFQQVFGKTIVCPNLSIAGQYARSHGVDGITPDGDTTNKRGAMTGGYVDPRRSRLEAVRNVNHWRDQYEHLDTEQRNIKKQIERKEQEITHALGELRKTEQKLRQAEDGFEPRRAELRAKTMQLDRARDQLEAATQRRDTIDKNMKAFSDNLAAHQAELASDFKKALNATEERQLEQCATEVVALQKEWTEVTKKRRDLENRKQLLEADLRQNLLLKEDQLSSQEFENSSASGGDGEYNAAQKEQSKLAAATKSIQMSLQENEQEIQDLEQQISDLGQQKAELELEQQEIAQQIEHVQKRMEKNLRNKARWIAQQAECAKNIKDLGVLPEEAFGKYEKMNSNQIESRLKKVNEALKKYKHVNKKAFEQYNSFTNQQDHLMKRREELDKSQESIEELVAHLDQRKDEAIERTFRQVSKEFATIFQRLVPAGHGLLVIHRKTDRRQDPVESDDEQQGSVENYTGVGISVAFNSKHDEQQKIQQLSGGQKSLCALCLIFALQATESSPMVIFDEVDANLDAQYRTAVAGLLDSISKTAGTQFICTTFRPEIVHVADKCYGVTFHNKTSSVDCVPSEDALNFVEGQAAPR